MSLDLLRRSQRTTQAPAAAQQMAFDPMQDALQDPLEQPATKTPPATTAAPSLAPTTVEVKDGDDGGDDAPGSDAPSSSDAGHDLGGGSPDGAGDGTPNNSRPSGGGDVAMHQALAEETVQTLEGAASTEALPALADTLEQAAGARLEPGIGMTIQLGAPGADQAVNVTVRIAPNDTIFSRPIKINIPAEASSEAKALITAINEVLGEKKAGKGETDPKLNQPMGVILTLAAASASVRAEVAAAAGPDLLELLEKARLKNLWKNPEAAAAVVLIIQSCPASAAVEMIDQLLSWHPLDFDLTVDRWEARLAWEMLEILPAEQRRAILADGIRGDNGDQIKENHKLSKHVNNRIEKNLSKEYKTSTRFETFEGNDRPEVASDVDATTDGAGDDTARETLLMNALDPALWSGENPGLEPALRMVLISKDQSTVSNLVKQYWTQNQRVLEGLGFRPDGSHGQDIQDNTATTWVTRTIAGIKAIGDMWSLITTALSTDKVVTIDLKNIETALMQKYGGVYLDHTIDEKTKLDVASTIFSLIGVADTVLNFFDVGPTEFLDLLLLGKSIHDKIDQKIKARATVNQLTNGDATDDPKVAPNKLLMAKDKTGHTVMKVGLLPVAAQAAAFGTTTVKTGPCLVANAVIDIKAATAHDGTSGAHVSLARAVLTQVQLISEQDITLIDEIVVSDLHFDLEGQVEEPVALVGRIALDVMQTMLEVFQLLPGGSVPGAIGEAIGSAFPLMSAVMSLSDDSFRQVGFSFGGASVKGVHSASGMAVDEVSIGGTAVSFKQPAFTAFEKDTRDELLARQTDLTAKLDGYNDRLEGGKNGKKPTGESLKVLQEQIAWTNDALAWIARRLPIVDQVRELQGQIDTLKKERNAKAKPLGKENKVEAKKHRSEGAHHWEKKQLRKEQALNDYKELEALDADIAKLEQQLTLLEGFEVSGTIGTVTVEGAAVPGSGVSVGAARLEETTITTETTATIIDGETQHTGHVTARSGGLELHEVEIGGSERRDELVRGQLQKLHTQIDPLAVREQSAEAPLNRDERAALLQLRGAATRLEEELAILTPMVAEYEALRARLTDRQNPLSPADQSRLIHLRDQLRQPPTTLIEGVLVTGITAEVGTDPSKLGSSTADLAGASTAELKLDHVEVKGLTIKGDGPDAGDTLVSSVSADDASMSWTDGTFDLKGGNISVAGITKQGDGVAGARRIDELKGQLAEVDQRIAALDGLEGRDTEREALQQQRAAITAELQQLEAKQGAPARMDALIGAIDATTPKLVDAAGINRASAFSLKAAQSSILAFNSAIYDLVHGPADKQGQPGTPCLDEAARLIGEYTAGVDMLLGQIAAFSDSEAKTITERSAKHFDRRELDDLKATLAAAQGELLTWLKLRDDLAGQKRKLLQRRVDMQRIEGLYYDLLNLSTQLGLDYVAIGVDCEDEASATQMRAGAVAQRDGFKDITVGSVVVDGLNLQLDGALNLLHADPKTGALPEAVTLSGGDATENADGDANLVDRITVKDVKQGDQQLLGELDVKNVGGKVTVLGTNHFRVDDITVASVVLDSVDWESASMALHTEGATSLTDLSVTAEFDSTDGKDLATITKFRVGGLRSAGIDFRYADYLVHLGSAVAGAGELAAIEVTDFDMNTFAFKDVALGDLKTTDLGVDLGGGMKLNAKKLNAGQIHVGAVVTEQEKQNANDDDRDASADKYSFSLNGVDAEKMKFEMEGMGVEIKKLTNGNFDKITFDMTTGEFTFTDLDLDAIKLGALGYVSGGMTVKMAGGDFTGVKISGSGKMLFDEDEASALEAEDKNRSVDSIRALKLNLSANAATLRGLHYINDSAGSKQNIFIQSASATAISLRDYDYTTGALKLDAADAKVKNLKANLTDALSSTQLNGSYEVGHFGVGMLKDGTTTMNLVGLNTASATTLNLGSIPAGQVNNKPGDQDHSTTTTTIDAIQNANANITMKGNAWKGGSTTSFTGVSLEKLQMSFLKIDAPSSGGSMELEGHGVALNGLSASGHTTTEMVPKRGMMLPETTLEITHLHVDTLDATELTLNSSKVVMKDDEPTFSSLDVTKNGDRAVHLKSIDVTDLKFKDDGDGSGLKNGSIKVAEADLSAGLNNTLSGLLPGFAAAGHISASGLFVNILDGGKKIQTGVATADAADVVFTTTDENGGGLVVHVPHARLDDVTADFNTGVDTDDLFTSSTNIHVGTLNVLEDASVVWTRKGDKSTQYTSEESALIDRQKQANSYTQGGDNYQPTEDKRSTLDTINLSGLLGTLGGDIHARLKMNDWMYGTIDIAVSKGVVTDAKVDMSLLIDILGYTADYVFGVPYSLVMFLINNLADGVNLKILTGMLKDAIAPHAEDVEKKLRKSLADDVADQTTTAEWLASFTPLDPLVRPDQGTLEERYDASAAKKRKDRDAKIAAMEAALAKYGNRFGPGARAQIEAYIELVRKGKDATSAIDLWIEDLNADISVGPWSSALNPVKNGKTTSTNLLHLDKLGLDLKQVGTGAYNAAIDDKNVQFRNKATDGSNTETVFVGVDEIDLGTSSANLFPDGKLSLMSTKAGGMLENPVKATLHAGSKVKGITLKTAKKYVKG